MSPAERDAYVRHVEGRTASADCYEAIDRHWPVASRQWADPDCNVRAMLHLYREAGTSPWSL